jgi:uncharacterized protein YoxC
MQGSVDMTQEASLEMIAYCQLISTAAVAALAIALIIFVFKMKKLVKETVDDAMTKITPILEQTKAVAEQAKATAETIGAKVDNISNKAETTANKVGDTVQLLSGKVDQAVTPKVAAAIGIAGAAIKLAELYTSISKIRKHK